MKKVNKRKRNTNASRPQTKSEVVQLLPASPQWQIDVQRVRQVSLPQPQFLVWDRAGKIFICNAQNWVKIFCKCWQIPEMLASSAMIVFLYATSRLNQRSRNWKIDVQSESCQRWWGFDEIPGKHFWNRQHKVCDCVKLLPASRDVNSCEFVSFKFKLGFPLHMKEEVLSSSSWLEGFTIREFFDAPQRSPHRIQKNNFSV
jgi:hypothetical protein